MRSDDKAAILEHNKQDIVRILRGSVLCKTLSPSQMERVRQCAEVKYLEDGETLFMQGQVFTHFYCLLVGKIKLYRVSSDGQEKILEIIPAGGTFAEALMFMDQPQYPVSAAALAKSSLLAIDGPVFKAILGESVETCMLLLGDMSKRLHKMVNEIDSLTLHTGTCRIATYLLENLGRPGQYVELDIAKNVIAARLSVKPETFSRIIKNLRDQGVLSISGRRITVHDRERLRELALL